jgi:hypothetical protein
MMRTVVDIEVVAYVRPGDQVVRSLVEGLDDGIGHDVFG